MPPWRRSAWPHNRGPAFRHRPHPWLACRASCGPHDSPNDLPILADHVVVFGTHHERAALKCATKQDGGDFERTNRRHGNASCMLAAEHGIRVQQREGVPRKHQPGKVARWQVSRLLPGLTADPQGYCLGRSAVAAPEPVEHLAHDYGLRWGSMHANGAGADCLEANRLALPDSPGTGWKNRGGSRRMRSGESDREAEQ
jgi:hypothetical protein